MSNETPAPAKATVQTKRLIVCCDGTGQSSSNGKGKVPTNVFRFAQALKPSTYVDPDDTGGLEGNEHRRCAYEVPQIVLYQNGIGADGISHLSNSFAQAFGAGMDTHILEAYTFIANNYEEGDEIFLFGFSRGAFTARAIGSLICNGGLLKKSDLKYLHLIYDHYKLRRATKETRKEFDDWMKGRKEQGHFSHHTGVVIRVMGLWDTVGSLGIPETGLSSVMGGTGIRERLNRSYGYHDTSLPTKKDPNDWRAYITLVYQALALEETRISFGPTLLHLPKNGALVEGDDSTGFMQCWFPGIHTDVGGGYERAYRDISDLSLLWMVDKCSSALEFHEDLLNQLKTTSLEVEDPGAPAPSGHKVPKDLGWGLSEIHDEYHTPTFLLGGAANRKPGQYYLDQRDEGGQRYRTEEHMHSSIRIRMLMKTNKDGSRWRPSTLEGFELSKEVDGIYQDNWKWKKEVKGAEPIVIYEDQLGNTELQLLTAEELKLYYDEKASLALNMESPEPEGWYQWVKKQISAPFS